MKNVLLFIAFLGLSFVVSCDKDDDTNDSIDYQYSILINSPNEEDKHLGDSIHIHVDFASATGEAVHHIKVRIYNENDNSVEIYNQPGDAHVHALDGMYEFHADLGLTNDEGVTEHTDWILEASVWGEEDGEAEVVESIGFHVHP